MTLIKRFPSAHPFGRNNARFKLFQPFFVFTDLRVKRFALFPAHGVVLFGLAWQVQNTYILLSLNNASGEIILMPPGHNQNHLCAGSQTGTVGVCPFIPQTVSRRFGVRFFSVLDRVVDNHQRTTSTGHTCVNTSGDHAAHMVFKLKFKLTGRAGGHFDTEDLVSEFADFFAVLAAKLSGIVSVI